MFVKQNQVIPNHYHNNKKEDIICVLEDYIQLSLTSPA